MLSLVPRLLAACVLLAALVLVPVASVAAGGGCHGGDGAVHTDGTAHVVRMDVCTFEPTVARVAVGTEVRFLNTASVQHIVTGERQAWGSRDELSPGQEVRRRFDTEGVFPYSCPLHPGMVGAIVVGDAPAAAAGGEAPATSPAVSDGEIAPAAAMAVGLGGVVGGLAIAGLGGGGGGGGRARAGGGAAGRRAAA